MDYEKLYNNALERAKERYHAGCFAHALLEYIFPELKQNDESIREWLIGYFNQYVIDGMPVVFSNGLNVKDIIAWLKVQSENKKETNISIDLLDCSEEYRKAYYDGYNKCNRDWFERQGTSYTKRDVDDAYVKGIAFAENELKKQYKADYPIRKDIALFIYNYKGDIKDRAKWMDYLGIKVIFDEKLGDNQQGKTALEAINEEKVDNDIKVESDFKIGDWVVRKDEKNFYDGNKTTQITKIDEDICCTVSAIWVCIDEIRYWTLNDAKDGDVLVNGSNIFIFSNLSGTRAMGYCHVNLDDKKFYDDRSKNECFGLIDAVFTPANDEQRACLFAKMKEVGYEWDANKKELRKVMNN